MEDRAFLPLLLMMPARLMPTLISPRPLELVDLQSKLSFLALHSTLESLGDTVFAGDTRTTLGCSAEQEISSIHGSIRLFSWRQIWVTARPSEPARSPSHSFPASSSACAPLVPPRHGPGNMSPRRIPLFICRLWQQASSLSLDLILTDRRGLHPQE